MTNEIDRDRVLFKIERVLSSFQEILKAGSRPTFFLPEPKAGESELLELRNSTINRFLGVSRILFRIYEAVKTNSFLASKDIFEDSTDIFVHQAALDDEIDFVARLLQESRSCLHIESNDENDLVIRLRRQSGSWEIIKEANRNSQRRGRGRRKGSDYSYSASL